MKTLEAMRSSVVCSNIEDPTKISLSRRGGSQALRIRSLAIAFADERVVAHLLDLRGSGRVHQFADRIEDDGELLVVLLFQLFELAGQIGMTGEELSQTHEGPHDGDIHFDGPLAAENAGEHRDALLGEGVWTRPPPATPVGT